MGELDDAMFNGVGCVVEAVIVIVDDVEDAVVVMGAGVGLLHLAMSIRHWYSSSTADKPSSSWWWL